MRSKLRRIIMGFMFNLLFKLACIVYRRAHTTRRRMMKFKLKELGSFMQKDAAVAAAVVPFLDHAKAVVSGLPSNFNLRRKVPTLLANVVGSFFDFYDEVKRADDVEQAALANQKKKEELSPDESVSDPLETGGSNDKIVE